MRSYVWGMRLITLFSFSILGLIVYYLDPEKTGLFGLILFYLTLFFAFSGFFNLVLIWARKKALDGETAFSNVGLSFRQGILLALILVIILILQGLRMLFWWDGLLAVAGVFLIELYFLSRK